MNKPPVGPPPGWDQPQQPQQPPPEQQPQYYPPPQPVTIVNQITVSSHSQATAVASASARSGGNQAYGCLGCALICILVPMLCGGGCLMLGALVPAPQPEPVKKSRPAAVKREAKPAPSTVAAEPSSEIKLDEPPANPRLRTWRNHDGKFFAEAELMSTLGEKATLKRKDGKTVEVIVSFLHKDDQDYIRDNAFGR